jgi:hypothetical protein
MPLPKIAEDLRHSLGTLKITLPRLPNATLRIIKEFIYK